MRTPEPFTTYSQVSLFVQPTCDGIKGHTFFWMLSNGPIQEKPIFRIVIAGKGRGSISDGEVVGKSAMDNVPLHRPFATVECGASLE